MTMADGSEMPAMGNAADDGLYRHRMAGGDMVSVSRFADDAVPTASETSSADDLWSSTVAALRRFENVDAALTDGYVQTDSIHYVNPSFVNDDRELDVGHIEGLLYVDDARVPGGKALVAAMYVAAPGHHGRQVGGPLTVWHYHDWSKRPVCLAGVPIGSPGPDGTCDEGIAVDTSPEMLHVWPASPSGRFAPDMTAELTESELDAVRAVIER